MKIVVVGGTGLIGSQVVARLGEHGHEAVSASPASGVNTLTGEGLKEVLQGADVLIDVSNSPSFADDDVMAFFRTATENMVEAGKEAGISHYVALSVVGSDRLPSSGYLRAKVAQEKLIQESGLPHSIVRATQFFEFAVRIADSATVDGTVRLPDARVQPIAAEEVAAAVARTSVGAPVNGVHEVGGPAVLTMAEWIGAALSARGDERPVVVDASALYFGASPGADGLVTEAGAELAKISLTDWIAAQK